MVRVSSTRIEACADTLGVSELLAGKEGTGTVLPGPCRMNASSLWMWPRGVEFGWFPGTLHNGSENGSYRISS